MNTRRHVHAEDFDASPQRVFTLLITPSAIRQWWGAARAVVLAKPNGTWSAAWGPDEDRPEYVCSYRIATLDPPRTIVMDQSRYQAHTGELPFDASGFVTTFEVLPRSGGGATLRVTQDGFPCDPAADGFYAACETGWRNTFAGIRRFLAEHADQPG